jgi:hypothetical protein
MNKFSIKKSFTLLALGSVLITSSGCYNNQSIDLTTQENYDTTEVTTEVDKTEYNSVEINNEVETTEANIEITTEIEITESKNNNDYDIEVINYFNEKESEINQLLSQENVEQGLSKIGDYIATMIGFIWYGEEINGVTYNQLSNEAKDTVLNIYYRVDAKIENKIPNYKEKIKDKYQIVSNFIKDKYDDLKYSTDEWLKEKLSDEEYQKYTESVDIFKEQTKESIDDVNELKDKAVEKVDEWYQKKKSK